jgi:proline racemase
MTDDLKSDRLLALVPSLRPTQPKQEDPNIAAALAAAAGRSPAPQSLSDRLAALKARGGA